MATCPKCHKFFKVMEDELPESHGCPYCRFVPEWHETPDVEADILEEE
jgi:hypothetical protein